MRSLSSNETSGLRTRRAELLNLVGCHSALRGDPRYLDSFLDYVSKMIDFSCILFFGP